MVFLNYVQENPIISTFLILKIQHVLTIKNSVAVLQMRLIRYLMVFFF